MNKSSSRVKSTNGSESFKMLGLCSVWAVGGALAIYYIAALYYWFTDKTPVNFEQAFYFLGIVLPVSGLVHVGSKFANRG